MLGVAIALLFLATVLLAARPWKRPSPRHEFMLDLCTRMLGDESVDGKALSSKGSSSPGSFRRAG